MKSSLIFILTALAALATPCRGQKFSFGSCPTVASLAITLSDLPGSSPWYEYARTPSIHRHFIRCATYSFTQVTPNLLYRYIYNAVNKVTKAPIRRQGTTVIGGGLAQNTLRADGYIGFIDNTWYVSKNVRYYAVGANSVGADYLVLYACEEVKFGKLESAILLHSTANLAASVISSLSSLWLGSIGVNPNLLKGTFDGDC